jgi:pyruvate/2-oxoglutarate dehydrogenase complex dihydrolipoamide acyltransferase (E2) component
MTETAASPWWADVQHLRPRDDDRGAAPAPRTWADDAGFTDALKRDRFATDVATDTASTAVATAVLDLSDFEDALAAVRDPLPATDGPLPLDFDVDDVDWTPTRRPASEILEELDWQPAKRFARAAAELSAGRESRFERVADATAGTPAAPLPAAQPARRTITLTGDVDARTAAASVGQGAAPRRQRRPRATPAERMAARPDRIALYAVILGIVLILVAALSAPGAEAALLQH